MILIARTFLNENVASIILIKNNINKVRSNKDSEQNFYSCNISIPS